MSPQQRTTAEYVIVLLALSVFLVMPSGSYLFTTSSNGVLGRVDVDTGGNVTIINGSNVWISLDGLHFKAEA